MLPSETHPTRNYYASPKMPISVEGDSAHLTHILARPTHAANGTSTGPVVCEGPEDVTLPKNCQFPRGNSGPT